MTLEQSYLQSKVEKNINQHSKTAIKSDVKFVDKLVTLIDVIRKTYFDDDVDEIISTRRLNTSIKRITIFDDKMNNDQNVYK